MFKATILVVFFIPFSSVIYQNRISSTNYPPRERLMEAISSKFLGPQSGVCFFGEIPTRNKHIIDVTQALVKIPPCDFGNSFIGDYFLGRHR